MGDDQRKLPHEATDSFCHSSAQENRIALMRSAKGLWKNRGDVLDLQAVRKEMDASDE